MHRRLWLLAGAAIAVMMLAANIFPWGNMFAAHHVGQADRQRAQRLGPHEGVGEEELVERAGNGEERDRQQRGQRQR